MTDAFFSLVLSDFARDDRFGQDILNESSAHRCNDHLGSEYCPMAVFKHLTGELAGTVVEMNKDVNVIGRLPECDIVLNANGVSRRHAEIRRVGLGYSVVDLDSRNKTFVNQTE